MNSTRSLWAILSIAAVAAAMLVAGWLYPSSADASSAVFTPEESHLLASVNDHRVRAGLHPLWADPTLTASAVEWTSVMATRSYIGHADIQELEAAIADGYEKVGENVGRGATTTSLIQAFMQSPSHRNNILDPVFTHIGVGVVIHPSTGRIYATLRFGSIPSAPAPAPVASVPTVAIPADPPPAAATTEQEPEPATATTAAKQSPPQVAREPRGSRMVDDSEPTSGLAGGKVPEPIVDRGARRGVD